MPEEARDDTFTIPPATLEGWYALHQVFSQDWSALRALSAAEREGVAAEASALLAELGERTEAGWSAAFHVVGGRADWMLIHFRETLEELGRAELRVRRSAPGRFLRPEYDYTSVTEAALYYATAEAAQKARPGTDEFRALLDEMAATERESPHIRRRLYPEPPTEMRYVSFYPMSKRRVHPDNWYTLPVAERNRLMREHGITGRRYAGRVNQVITGSVGLDDWEWGVTLFARDMLEIKRVVTEMRYDEASARYAEFGRFYVGTRISPEEWARLLTLE